MVGKMIVGSNFISLYLFSFSDEENIKIIIYIILSNKHYLGPMKAKLWIIFDTEK